MEDPNLSSSLIEQGRALAQAIRALRATEIHDPFERAVAELLRAAYERRLLEILEAAPDGLSEEVLSRSTQSTALTLATKG